MREFLAGLTLMGWAAIGWAATPVLAQGAPSEVKPPILVPQASSTTNYDPRSGFPDHNGKLSGMLVVIPKAELSEFGGPSGSDRHLDRVSRAEPGAALALKLVFIGVEADWKGNANVTYDLQITGPDGRIYAGSDYKALSAIHGPIGDGKGVFDNRDKVVLLQFEPQDAVGVYAIKTILHDKVSQVDLPLEAKVELISKNRLLPAPAVLPAEAPVATPEAAPADPTPVKSGKKRRRKH